MVASSCRISEAYTKIQPRGKPLTLPRPTLYHIDGLLPPGTRAMAARKKSAKLLRCPTCGMLVCRTDEDFPFCSDRCRKIDLGKWAMGVYKISSPILDPEVLEDLGRDMKDDSYEN
jgi:endogenous inhibitor of DNA gyrase (YacG/DUF329 family)